MTNEPSSKFTKFSKSLPSASEFPLEPIRKDSYFQDGFGVYDELPDHIKQVVKQIRNAKSIEEKVAISHNYTLAAMKPESQYSKDPYVKFKDLVHSPVGDCDDYMIFNAGLLYHGGVEPDDIFLISGVVEYNQDDKTIEIGHHFIVVKDGESYFVLDNNLMDVKNIDSETPTITSAPAGYEGNDHKEDLQMTIKILAAVGDASGYYTKNEAALQAMLSATIEFSEKVKANNINTPPPRL